MTNTLPDLAPGTLTWDELPFLSLELDQKRCVVSCSPQAQEVFSSDIIGKKFDQLISRSDRTGLAAYLAKLSGYAGGFLDLSLIHI